MQAVSVCIRHASRRVEHDVLPYNDDMRDTEEVPDLGFVSEENRKFIDAISGEMETAGYRSDIGPGYCWGK